MADITEEFEYTNGVWKTVWYTRQGRQLKLFVTGDADLMGSLSALIQLRRLMNSIDDRIDKASTFACDSEYRDDISLAGGMDIASVIVNTWNDLKIWFSLRASDHMMGVRMHDDQPVDVFCDKTD